MASADDRPTFAVDAMLGRLAKALRILGYDAHYDSRIDDSIRAIVSTVESDS